MGMLNHQIRYIQKVTSFCLTPGHIWLGKLEYLINKPEYSCIEQFSLDSTICECRIAYEIIKFPYWREHYEWCHPFLPWKRESAWALRKWHDWTKATGQPVKDGVNAAGPSPPSSLGPGGWGADRAAALWLPRFWDSRVRSQVWLLHLLSQEGQVQGAVLRLYSL